MSGLHISHQGSRLFPSLMLIDRGYDSIRGETREGAERGRGNRGGTEMEGMSEKA